MKISFNDFRVFVMLIPLSYGESKKVDGNLFFGVSARPINVAVTVGYIGRTMSMKFSFVLNDEILLSVVVKGRLFLVH